MKTRFIFPLMLCAGLLLAFGAFYTVESSVTPDSSSIETAIPEAGADSVADSSDISSPATVADVVTNALAFKAQLTSAQQATLEQTYTASLARKWSNLPCGANCRNGIRFSTLTAQQLSGALAVIQAAAGTAASEGYDEFLQIRLADDYLGANGGGAGYSGGIYFIAFLNTPTTTGAWMLQYGGHHWATNIAFNGGHVVGTTPQFEGVEPTSFTVGGTTYTPLAQEHDAMANMLASFTTAQLSTAHLSQTFSDVTMSPGETNGGNGTFPAVKVGIQANALTAGQQQLVLAAMQPWLKDADDTVAGNLLTLYANEINGTFIAYTGNGTSGNPSSFLNANTNYVRIDGPSVWIEFICQNGVVFPAQIHYHSVFRDHARDYGADLTLTTPLDGTGSPTPTPTATPVSTATPTATPVPTVTPTATPPPTATPTATPVPTATPSVTATPVPTATPSVTATTTPAPTATPSPAAQPLNLSTRMFVQTGDNVGIGGFIIAGSASKHVLLRAIGPSLAGFGIPNPLLDTTLELNGPSPFPTVTNDNWRDDPAQEALIIASGLAPSNDLEAAIDITLAPGAYTAIIRGKNNSTGVGVVEAFDLSQGALSKMANISTRAFCGTTSDIIIAGFILGNSNGNDRVILRGIGPSLSAFGVPNVLVDPFLELRDQNGSLLMSNDDWQDDPAQAAEMTAANLAPSSIHESGIAATLPPGAYTALLSGQNNGNGNGVVEVYDRGAGP